MSDDFWLSLSRVAATPKKDRPEQRQQEPMHAQIKGPRRNPSADQKSQRRQQKRHERGVAGGYVERSRQSTRTAATPAALYHGTNVQLAPGDTLRPATLAGHRNFGDEYTWYDPYVVYLSTQDFLAERYALGAVRKNGGEPHVYLVRPIGSCYPDPESESGFGTDQWCATMGEIVREIPLPGLMHLEDGVLMRGPAKKTAWKLPDERTIEVDGKRIELAWDSYHKVTANYGSALVGILTWWEDQHTNVGYEILGIEVDKRWQRKGLATAMLQYAREISGDDIHHSPALTDDGKEFAKNVARVSALTTKEWPGEVGNGSHITMEENGTVPTAAVASLLGVNGETPGAHRNRQGNRWEEFKADIAANGITDPIFITVDWGGVPKISEGNHRRDAAVEVGLDEVPVQIRYFGHAEQQGTLLTRIGKTAVEDYQTGHQPGDDGPSLDYMDDPDSYYPPDVYEHPEHYVPRGPAYSDESIAVMLRVRGRPNAMVTIYRAAPPGHTTINTGDWVAITPSYARLHRESNGKPDWVIYSASVPARSIRNGGNDLVEWGYAGAPIQAHTAKTAMPEGTLVGDGSGYKMGKDTWFEAEPGMWVIGTDSGIGFAYERAAMVPEAQARFDAKFGPGKKCGWQRNLSTWLLDSTKRKLSGTAATIETAKEKAATAGQKLFDEVNAEELERMRKLFGPTWGTPEYRVARAASSIEIKIGDWILDTILEAVAWEDGKVIGAVEVAKPYYRVEKVYVRPSHRRQGIATMLVRALEQRLGRELPPGDELSPSGAAWASSLTGKEYYDTWGQDGKWEGWLDRLEKGGARSASLRTDIEALRPELAAAVQRVVDEWEPSDEGFDEEYGYGGACDNAADAMMSVLGDHGIDTAQGGQDGDDHAWVVALRGDEVVGVDVPPGVYETGGGYSWRKLPDASISPRQVEVFDIDVPAENFREGAKTLDEAISDLADVILKAPPSSGEGYSIWGERKPRVDPDWAGVLKRVKTMYRGYTLRVTENEYEMLFGTGRSRQDKAEYLLGLLGKRGLGTHWTTHRGEAAGFAGMNADRGDVRVLVWADPPRPEDVLIGEGTKGMGIQAWDDLYGEQEIPIRAGAPIHMKRLEWGPGGPRPMARADDGGGWDGTWEVDAIRTAKMATRFEPSQMSSWPSTKPWNLTKAEAEAQLVPGWWGKSARGTESASWEKGYIRPSPEFFGHPEQARRAIAYHEAGHAMIEAAGGISSVPGVMELIDLPGGETLGYNGEEIIAEAYSVLWTEPVWFERAGARAIRDLTIDLAKRAGFPLPSTSRSAMLHTAAKGVPVVKWVKANNGMGGSGVVSNAHGPVICYRGFGSWGEAKDSLQRGAWKSSGMFTVRGEGETQMAVDLQDVLASAGLHGMRGTGFLGYIEADVSGLPFSTFRAPEFDPNDPTSGTIEADTGLGIGINGGIPLDRIRKVVAIDENGKQTPMTVQGLRNSIDKLQDREGWAPQVSYRPETHKVVLIWERANQYYHLANNNQDGAECGARLGYSTEKALVRQGELMAGGKVENLWAWAGETTAKIPRLPCRQCFEWARNRAAAKVAVGEVSGVEHAMNIWRRSFGTSNMIARAAIGEVTEEPYLSAAQALLGGIADAPRRRYVMRVDHRLPAEGEVLDFPLISAAAKSAEAVGFEQMSNAFGVGDVRGVWYEMHDLPALGFPDGREFICSGQFRVTRVSDYKPPWENEVGSFVPLRGKRKLVQMEYVGPSSKVRISHAAMAVPLFKGTERNMSERNVIAAANRILADIAREYGYHGELPAIEITDNAYELGSAAARSVDINDRNRDLWPHGCILLDRSLVERAQDKELGYTEFRIVAHEAIHALIQREEPSYPGYSQMITEGGAEVLSVAYWAKQAPGFDDRDAVRINGKWVPGDTALVHGMNYKEWVQELMARTASKVGWNLEAILREVQRIVAGNTTVKLDFRDTSNPHFAPPPGVENTAEGLMLWLIGQITDRAPHSRFGALSLEAVISVAEETMERAGLAGKTLHIPTGHVDDPEYQAALAPYVQMVSEWCGRPIRFYANDYILDTDGGGAQALTDGINRIVVRPTTTTMTILHEAAHVILHEAESYGHTAEFVSTVEQLYRDHLGDAAADQFMLIVGDHV